MNGLSDLRMFAEIAGARSLSAAAGRLGMSSATISGRLKAMEQHYGVALVRRTTRALSLTDDGRILLRQAQTVLDDFRELERAMTGRKRAFSGQLVISSPLDFGRRCVAPMVHAFLHNHPDLDFALRFDSGEPAAERSFDVAFRIGALPNSTLITRRVGEARMITCAAPTYLSRRREPALPADLLNHRCLARTADAKGAAAWTYRSSEGEVKVGVPVAHAANDVETLKEMALAGHGVLRTADFNVAEALAAGALVPLLTAFEPDALAIHLLSERRHLMPLRAAQFVDFATGRAAARTGCRPSPLRDRAAA